MSSFTTRLAALLAGGALAFGVVACEDRNDNQINEGSESDAPGATVPTNTGGLGPSDTTPETSSTQEQQPLTQTSP